MRNMKEFKTYHPFVNFIYFLFVIGFSMFFMHPFCLIISLLCGFSYSVLQKGKKAIKNNLIFMLPMMITMALINPLFNHEGVSVIIHLPSGNPITLEAIIYGLCASVMIFCVICHFSCYNEIMTSDKFIYLFGSIIPSLSLILTMTFRFVPRFIAQFKSVANAQKCIGNDIFSGSIIKRAKCLISITSIMITWSLENSIETADSMKSRGYGEKKRTSFSNYKFDKRDKKALICILFLGVYTFIGNLLGAINFYYFPSIKATEFSPFGISVFISYFVLCLVPIIIELWEVKKWEALESQI